MNMYKEYLKKSDNIELDESEMEAFDDWNKQNGKVGLDKYFTNFRKECTNFPESVVRFVTKCNKKLKIARCI